MSNQTKVYELWLGDKVIASAIDVAMLLAPQIIQAFGTGQITEMKITVRQDNAKWDCGSTELTWDGTTVIDFVRPLGPDTARSIAALLNEHNAFPAGDEFS